MYKNSIKLIGQMLVFLLIPAAFLFIFSPSAQAVVGLTVGNGTLNLGATENLIYGNIGTASSPTSNYLLFQKNGSSLFNLDSSGNLLTTGSITANTFAGSITSGSISSANVSTGAFGSNTGGGTYSFPGNVGIGITNPGYKLEVRGSAYIQGFMGVMAGEGFSDKGMIGVFYDRNELTNAAYRGTSTISILNGGTFSDTVANKNLMVDSSGQFMAINELTASSIVELKFELPSLVSNYSRGYWQPFFQIRTTANDTGSTIPKSITVEVSNDGITWYKPSNGAWDTSDFINNSLNGLWMAPEGSPNYPTSLPGWRWKFARFTLSDFNVGTLYGLWISEVGVRHVSAPTARQFISAIGDTMYGGFNVMNGNVGINITNPGTRLSVVGDGTYSIDAGNNRIGNVAAPVNATDAVNRSYLDSAIATATSSISTLWGGTVSGNTWNLNSGNVGIGTTGPGAKLDIAGSVDPYIKIHDSGIVTGNSIGMRLVHHLDTWGDQYFRLTGIYDGVNYQDYLTIKMINGNVGIGTTNPLTRLHVSDATNALSRIGTISEAAGSKATLQFATHATNAKTAIIAKSVGSWGKTDLIFALDSASDVNEVTESDAKLTILNGGNVGIATTNPGTRLSVVGDGTYSIDVGNNRIGNVSAPVNATDAVNRSYLDSAIATATSSISTLWGGTVSGNTWNLNSGNVGIGTINPSALFTVAASNTPQIRILDEDASGSAGVDSTIVFGRRSSSPVLYGTIGFQANNLNISHQTSVGGIKFQTNSSDRMFIDNSGNVGIGTTAPRAPLDIKGYVQLGYDSNSPYIKLGGAHFDGTNNAYGAIKSFSSNSGISFLTFWTSEGTSQERMRITYNGNVGIATTNPGTRLSVVGDGTYSIDAGNNRIGNLAAPVNATDAVNRTYLDSAIATATSSISTLWGGTTGGNVWNLNSANVGIGTTNPAFALDVTGTVNSTALNTFSLVSNLADISTSLDVGSGGANDGVFVNGNASITGNLGIGTTNPEYALDITAPDQYLGQLRANGGLFGERTTNNYINIGYDFIGGEVGIGYGANDELIAGVNSAQTAYKFGGYNDDAGIAVNIASGNIGIGTTNPSTKLEVVGAINSNSTINGIGLCIAGDCKVDWDDVGGGASWNLDGNTVGQNTSFGTNDNYSVIFKTNNAERARLTNTGNFALGATTTGTRLHVESPQGAVAFFKSTLNGGSYSGYIGNGQTYSSEEFGLYYALNDTRLASYNLTTGLSIYGGHLNNDAALVINSAGNVGIGTTNPSQKLDIVGKISLADAGNSVFVGTGAGMNDDASANYNTGIGYYALNANTSGFYNTAIGYTALQYNTTGERNTAVGVSSLKTNTTGIRNTAIGYNSLTNNTTGRDNTANGYLALTTNTIGKFNTAIGSGSLQNNTVDYNTAVGYNSLYSNTTGSNNTAIGYSSLSSNTTGSQNTANGQQSLHSNTEGSFNTANGYYSLYSNTTGNNNTANGVNSLYSNTTGNYNTANGVNSLYSNTTGSNNTANGYASLRYNTTGTNNTANGYHSLLSNTTGTNNTANGYYSLRSNTTGTNNTANGYNSLFSNTTGSNNTANGYSSLNSNITGNNNTANGYYSLRYNTTGSDNTANGYYSLFFNNTGSNNTANGQQSLYANTTGGYNTANGQQSLYYNTTGSNNTANGYYSLYSNTIGNNNTAIGHESLRSNTTGNSNIAIGSRAGRYIADGTTARTTGDYGLYLGYNSKASADGTSNEIVIGYDAIGNGTNTATLGNDNIKFTILKGYVGIGTTEPLARLDLGGGSDGRLVGLDTDVAVVRGDDEAVPKKWIVDNFAPISGGGGTSVWSSNASGIYYASIPLRVGIGNTNPTAALEVGSSANMGAINTSDSNVIIRSMSNSDSYTPIISLREGATEYGFNVGYYGAQNNFQIYSVSPYTVNPRFTIERDTGDVGIGTTNPAAKLQVNGTSIFYQPIQTVAPTAANHAVTRSYMEDAITAAFVGMSTNITVKGSNGANCVLTFDKGMLTASTCP